MSLGESRSVEPEERCQTSELSMFIVLLRPPLRSNTASVGIEGGRNVDRDVHCFRVSQAAHSSGARRMEESSSNDPLYKPLALRASFLNHLPRS